MEGLEAGRPVVIDGKTATGARPSRLMLQARGYEALVMEGGSEAWVAQACPSPLPTASLAESPDPSTSR